MFLTPEGKPFFGGTYFPKRSRYNLPGFDELLARVAEVWARAARAGRGAGRRARSRTWPTTLAVRAATGQAPAIDDRCATAAQAATGLRDALMQAFDAVDGGFGGAPKFPQPAILDALLRHAVTDARRRSARSRAAHPARAWPKAACTTTWAADSFATAPTRDG